jgi:hypothetical protein
VRERGGRGTRAGGLATASGPRAGRKGEKGREREREGRGPGCKVEKERKRREREWAKWAGPKEEKGREFKCYPNANEFEFEV